MLTPSPFIQQVPFQAAAFGQAMTHAAEYQCAGNIFWIDFFWSPQPTVALNQKTIDVMKDDFFRTPTAWPAEHPIRIAIPSGCTASKLKKLHGSMQRYSPEEVEHGFLAAVARDIRAGEPEATLQWGPQAKSEPKAKIKTSALRSLFS